MTTTVLTWTRICDLIEIPRLGARTLPAPKGEIAIFRCSDDSVFALLNRCPHKHGPLSIRHGQAIDPGRFRVVDSPEEEFDGQIHARLARFVGVPKEPNSRAFPGLPCRVAGCEFEGLERSRTWRKQEYNSPSRRGVDGVARFFDLVFEFGLRLDG